MKNILAILLMVVIGLSDSNGQTMAWVPSRYVPDAKCKDQTNCSKNVVCYKLKYTPENTGTLTSYTTGFWIECKNTKSIITSNFSCLMEDKSEELLLCDKEGVILFNCSGNSGNVQVTKGKPTYLHQICFEPSNKGGKTNFIKDDLIGLSSSITLESQLSITEEIEYMSKALPNSASFCQDLTANLHLEGSLKSNGMVDLSWEPAKEVEGGIYKLFCKDQNDIMVELGKVESNLLKSDSDVFIYQKEHFLNIYGGYTFFVEYHYGKEVKERSNDFKISFNNDDFSLMLSPNPAKHYTEILVNAPQKTSILNLMDNNGKLIKTIAINNNINFNLDLNAIPAGVYSVTIESDQKVLSKKLIVIK